MLKISFYGLGVLCQPIAFCISCTNYSKLFARKLPGFVTQCRDTRRCIWFSCRDDHVVLEEIVDSKVGLRRILALVSPEPGFTDPGTRTAGHELVDALVVGIPDRVGDAGFTDVKIGRKSVFVTKT